MENTPTGLTSTIILKSALRNLTSAIALSAILLVFCIPAAHAQKETTQRIGVLYLGAPPNANLDAFIQGLRQLRYVEGKNILIEYRFAEGKTERLPELAIPPNVLARADRVIK